MTQIYFWILIGIMLIGSVLLFVLPIVKKEKQEDAEQVSRDALNKAFYRDRMLEIDEETTEGLVEDKEELALELKQSLLEDIPQGSKNTLKATSSLPLVPGIILFVVLVLGIYLTVGNYDKVVQWQETAARLPELSSRMMADGDDPMSDEEMTSLILALRTQLQKTPDDAMGWLLLGRLALANRDMMTAEGAMAKAYQLLPNDPDVVLGYAQSLMLTGDESNAVAARGLLKGLIKQDHANLQALSLLAFDAFERASYEEAKGAWLTMKQLLAPTDPRHSMLDRSIAKVDSLLNQGQGQSVTVSISLDPSIKLPSEGVLFVSAHSADGAPVPIAAKRLPLTQFPLEIELTDADSMIPERVLSSLSSFMLKARIDLDGDLITKDGYLGESQTVLLGEKTHISIDKKATN